jgi:hypothetical protein
VRVQSCRRTASFGFAYPQALVWVERFVADVPPLQWPAEKL